MIAGKDPTTQEFLFFRLLSLCHIWLSSQPSKIKWNDAYHRWSPDAIVFNSWQNYGCPNYWMLHFFKDSCGATFHPSNIQISSYNQLVASAITWQNSKDKSTYLKIKVRTLLSCSLFQREWAMHWFSLEMTKWAQSETFFFLQLVNFGNQAVNLSISVSGLDEGIKSSGSKKTVLTSSGPLDENSFQEPQKVSTLHTDWQLIMYPIL